ncbi:protein kinase domain-containing protein [Paludisphaera mucosa]|uniref:Protein kinase n=1 Tax=Paludisphaera mucosa TaxID=3030827 RepID=A0ABT6FD10_9BACT|nr:protein kinase [Paludisphaera mucosa]MDG3005329.1 protein kinase [Paludisphaera mucosa]
MTDPSPTADDHPDGELLAAFGRGEIDPVDADRVERHLDACASCRATLADGPADDPLVALLRASARTGPAEGEGEAAPVAIPSGYALEAVIGRGGMGVVHRARQVGLGRLVALKRIAAGADASPAELARFRVEAEAAASLRHPNIVPIHDVGVIDGTPFYAMELLEGGSLADRLAAGPMPAREAAALTATLARAIEHAHRGGVVHRDLKPPNVLFAGDGTPKVADFGLAKRLDAAAVTRSGAIMGTPSYMAPEQATGEIVGAHPPVDVYALGAILFECLTGRPPFLAPSPVETLDLVRSSEPPSPGRLQPGVPRDVQTICLTCLEKSPARRYATAAALADDLDRFLRGEPILARPAGPVDRLVKWARRRPSQAALATLAILAAAGAVAGALVHDSRLRAALGLAEVAANEAKRQRTAAESNYRDAREALGRLTGAFSDPRFRNVPRLDELRRVQLEAALGFYDHALARADPTDPVVLRDTAEAAVEAANLQIVLGRRADAEANLLRARRLLTTLAGDASDDPGLMRSRMITHLKLGVMLMDGEPARAVAELEQGLALAERSPDAASWQGRHDVAWCLHNLGSAWQLAGRSELADPHLARAATILDGLLRERPDDPGLAASTAQTYINLGNGRGVLGRLDQAEADFERAGDLLERATAEQPEIPSHAADLCDLAVNRGNLLAGLGRVDQAVEQLTEGLRRIAPLLQEEPKSLRLLQTLQNLHGARAQALEAAGRFAEAVPDWDRVIEILPDRPGRLGRRFLRLIDLARAGLAVRVRDEAAAILDHPDEPLKPADRYNVACALCLATAAPLDEAVRTSMIDTALRELTLAFAADPSLREAAKADADLAALAGREDFRKLLEAR